MNSPTRWSGSMRAAELVSFSASPATEPLYIVNPFAREDRLARMFETHPPLGPRVARLRGLEPWLQPSERPLRGQRREDGPLRRSRDGVRCDGPVDSAARAATAARFRGVRATGIRFCGFPSCAKDWAATYSPRGFRPKYHRRGRA